LAVFFMQHFAAIRLTRIFNMGFYSNYFFKYFEYITAQII
jgi:hypothetical protein